MTEDDRPSPRWQTRPIPAGIALVVLVGGLVLGLLLNAPDILRTAERQELGWQRSVGVAVMEPVAAVSRFLFLDRPRRALDSFLGRAPVTPVDGSAVDAQPSPTAVSPVTTAPATTPPDPMRRTVTSTDPLTMYIGGDSMVGQFGPMLDDRVSRSEMVQAEIVFEFESGLSRPDFLDWPARLERVSEELDPDVFVLYFGGNDAQAIYQPEGEWIDFGTPEWEAEYRRRVDGVMASLGESGHWVYWMGMPIVRSDTFRSRVRLLNEIYESEAARHPRVTFVEAWSVFAGPDGGYSEYLTDPQGNLVDMRLDDGVHYTTAGAIRLAEVVYGVLAEDWGLPPE